MAGADTRKRFRVGKIYRGSQVIFGERAHLLEVLRSVQGAKLLRPRRQAEVKQLQKLIATRTGELNGINPAWDRKFQKARRSETSAHELLRLAASLSPQDYLLARVLTEHAEAPPELLQHLALHPYPAVRENVARHPRTPQETLRQMATVEAEPLWFLVACNPACPPDLRDKLRARMRRSETPPTK